MERVIRDRAWALQRRREAIEVVRFWWYLWYVHGEGPRELLKLLHLSDDQVWGQWRDYAELDAIIAGTWTQDKPRPNPWPSAHKVATEMIKSAVGDTVVVHEAN